MTPNPLALIAEITHRCALHCVYCSNPLQMIGAQSELATEEWIRVFQEAARLGILHVHLTGGEPLARADLKELVEAAHSGGLYTNLITSGIGLSEARLASLVDAGLDHIQLSFQDSREQSANWIAGAKAHAHKVALAETIRRFRIAFTVNLVVHRQNLDHFEEMIAFAEQLQPDRMEIAHAQYYGWALKNRDTLMPTGRQLENCLRIVGEAQGRLSGRVRIDCVVPDYYARYPKACMGGWGRGIMLINPRGEVLPCHAAGVIPGMQFDNVREHPVEWIWRDSAAFQRFRGEQWMMEPCRSCERRTIDFGGCRCQAFLLTGDASATDPICTLAPTHHLIERLQLENKPEERSEEVAWSYRMNPSNRGGISPRPHHLDRTSQ
jgi:pyrroloquinoline quinone biosynthesis protein E